MSLVCFLELQFLKSSFKRVFKIKTIVETFEFQSFDLLYRAFPLGLAKKTSTVRKNGRFFILKSKKDQVIQKPYFWDFK